MVTVYIHDSPMKTATIVSLYYVVCISLWS